MDDYFRQLTDFEPRRAAQYRIQHYAWVGMNPKESDNRDLSRQVLQRLPAYLDHPTVLGIGEIGLNRVTRNEIATYTEQIEMAAERRELVLIHTPHLEDKPKGTRISVDVLRRYPELKPSRVLVDHAEEHTIEAILEHGYWAGLTLYPQTKISPQRAVDASAPVGSILVAGACAWGERSDCCLAAMEMRQRRHRRPSFIQVIFENPVKFLSSRPSCPSGRRLRTTSRRRSGSRAARSERGRTCQLAGNTVVGRIAAREKMRFRAT